MRVDSDKNKLERLELDLQCHIRHKTSVQIGHTIQIMLPPGSLLLTSTGMLEQAGVGNSTG